MLDPHLLRSDPLAVSVALQARGYTFDVAAYEALEAERKTLQVETQDLQAQRNRSSKEIGAAKGRGEDIEPLRAELAALSSRLKANETALEALQQRLEAWQLEIPNLPHGSVPEGASEADNVELHRWGELRAFEFKPRDHVDLGALHREMDFELGARLASSRFVVLSGRLARLQRALIQFMLDIHIQEHAYREVYVPFMVNAKTMQGTGQLPKFKEDLFELPSAGFFLIPTAEVPVTNLAREQILEAHVLPQRYVCHSPCFRSEAGSYGRDTRGMIRQHQFEKVELVQLVPPHDSYAALEELTRHAEVILERLGLPYRRVVLCTGDIGFAAAKTFDLEVWLPGQQTYREISSCSNFESFQARRIKARWRNPDSGKPELVHTLNGSGVAVGRALIAVMENYQQADGSIEVPAALQAYVGGETRLVPPG